MARLHADLSKTVIVLPRHVPHTHDTTYERTAVADPLAWGVPDLVNMVQSLARLSGAVMVPDLDEWALLPDKVTPGSHVSITQRPDHTQRTWRL